MPTVNQSGLGVVPVIVARGGTNSTTGALTCSSGNITVQAGNLAATGNVTAIKSAPAASVLVQCTNSDNTAAASPAGFEVAVGGATNTGDPYVNFLVSGAGSFTMGIDNSVSDNFVISTGAALGTNDNVRLVSTGAVSILRGDLDVTRALVGNVLTTVSNTSNTAITDQAFLNISVGGTTAGDAQTSYIIPGGATWSTGADNDVSDNYVIAASAALGTSNAASWSTAGALTNAGAITSTAGNISTSNGDHVLGTAGNKIRSTSVASTIAAGANSFGTVALSGAATTVVSTTAAATASMIFLQTMALGTVAVASTLAVSAISNGVSFTITPSVAADTSTVAWFIVN